MNIVGKSQGFFSCTFILATVGLLPTSRSASAQCPFDGGSTAADGPFFPASSRTVPLPDDGIFNFSTINIPAGVTITFQRNAANTPVFILATGDVTIAGTLSVRGGNATDPMPSRGGPGGFDGGPGGLFGSCGGAGLGPGGGGSACGEQRGYGGGFANQGDGALGGMPYGNSELIPLIGGSGGGGGSRSGTSGGGGGAGGGAILITSSGTVTLEGTVDARGGNGVSLGFLEGGGGGSGGAIRIVANTFAGSGQLLAEGGSGSGASSPRRDGGAGRVRIGACVNSFAGSFTGSTSVGFPRPSFVAGVPNLRIASVGGVAAPEDPSGSALIPTDITLPAGTETTRVELAATGVPPGTLVQVSVAPNVGQAIAVMSTPLMGTLESTTATVDIPLSTGVTRVGAHITTMIEAAASIEF